MEGGSGEVSGRRERWERQGGEREGREEGREGERRGK